MLGSSMDCPSCSVVIQKEDDEGIVGVKIGRELMSVAAKALKSNITRLAPLVLPISEQLLFASNFVARKVRDLSCLHTHAPCARCSSSVVTKVGCLQWCAVVASILLLSPL